MKLYFQFGAEFGKVFPFKMHGEISNSAWIRFISVNQKRAEVLPNLKLLHAFLMGKTLPNSAPNWKYNFRMTSIFLENDWLI